VGGRTEVRNRYVNEYGNDRIFYRAVEPDSLIAVLRHFSVNPKKNLVNWQVNPNPAN